MPTVGARRANGSVVHDASIIPFLSSTPRRVCWKRWGADRVKERTFESKALDLISLVIPAFNEGARIERTLRKVTSWLMAEDRPFEIIVVDDGSRDQTAELVRGLDLPGTRVLSHESNQGKGAAVRTGVAASRGLLVLICDADLSTPIEDLARLEAGFESAPIVIGSRAVPTASILSSQSPLRIALGRLFNLVIRSTTLPGIKDTQCGFKLLDGDLARQLFPRVTTDGFAFDVELLWLARRAGCSISEVGVTWRHDRASKNPSLARRVLHVARHRPISGCPQG